MVVLVALFILGGVIVALVGVLAHRFWGSAPILVDRVTSWASRRLGPLPSQFVILVVGLAASIAVMVPIGVLCRAVQASIDSPTYEWVHQQVSTSSKFTKLNSILTTMGNRPTVYWILAVAVILFAFAYRQRWWIPVSALVLGYAAQYMGQLWLSVWINRGHPPVPDAGTFPSGGVSRALMLYGIILVLSLPLLPNLSRAWKAGLFTGVALLGYGEAYSRLYLSLHWISDIVAGAIFGALIIFVASAAVRCATVVGAPMERARIGAVSGVSSVNTDRVEAPVSSPASRHGDPELAV